MLICEKKKMIRTEEKKELHNYRIIRSLVLAFYLITGISSLMTHSLVMSIIWWEVEIIWNKTNVPSQGTGEQTQRGEFMKQRIVIHIQDAYPWGVGRGLVCSLIFCSISRAMGTGMRGSMVPSHLFSNNNWRAIFPTVLQDTIRK